MTLPANRVLAAITAALLAPCLCVFLCGCGLDIGRTQVGKPLRVPQYDALEVGTTTLQESLDKLGAPDRLDYKSGEDYLWWHHLDETTLRFRLQLPIALFGYRHNLFQYVAGNERTNTIGLVFDERGVLERKSLYLPEEYRSAGDGKGAWRVHLSPRIEHSFLLVGDADLRDYDDLFRNGYLAGLDIGVAPLPPVTLGVGGHYQRFPGRTVTVLGSIIGLDDLEIFTLEGKLRLQVPVRILSHLDDAQEMWSILMTEEAARHEGWLLFATAGLGAALNSNLPVEVNGARSGNFFDASWGLTSSAEAGIEYSWKHLSVRLGAGYRSTDAFDEGNSGLPDDATSLETWTASLAVAAKF